jgi:hypothetical protein
LIDEHSKKGNDFVVSFYSNRKKSAVGHNDTYSNKGTSDTDFGNSIIAQDYKNTNMRGGFVKIPNSTGEFFGNKFDNLERLAKK